MSNLALKDGREIELKILDFSQLEELVSQDLPTYDANGYDKIFEGFAYLGPFKAIDMKRLYRKKKYEQEINLSFLEIHPQPLQSKDTYHKALAAYEQDQLAGILVCQWIKGKNPFWTYHIKFIDVHEDYKHNGVGTHLTKALDQADFLKGHILQKGTYSHDGKKHIAHVMERELKAKDYALIPAWYKSNITPISHGIYDIHGNKIRTEKENPRKKSWLQRFSHFF
jgi:GNAT superfamily N-acetyltransferase